MRLHTPGLCRLRMLALGLAVGAASGFCATARAQQARPTVDEYGRQLEWIYFPVNPPVLGAEVAVIAASRQANVPSLLRAFLVDPFYPQVASRIVLVEGELRRPQPFTPEEIVHLDAFLGLRAALVGEIYDRSDRIMQLEPVQRLAAFHELARAQEARLAAMERSGEWLRQETSKIDPWSEYRGWRLNRGSLRQPRDKTYVLEFQVVRAAAYYQPGFSPGQRRLIRELAIEMNETIATHGQLTGENTFIMFFSPDTSRIIRPTGTSSEFEQMIDRYVMEKRRLKDELREVIYETDGAVLEYTRTKRIEDLAAAQAGAIERLEEAAEDIRREMVHLPNYRRYRGSPRLEARLEERLQAFSEELSRIESDRAAFIRDRIQRSRTQNAATASGPVVYETVSRARAIFEMQQGNRLMEHERKAEALVADLIEALPPEEAGRLNGSAAIALRDFIERRAEQDAYADYDLAALEPGLSPAQRRLMLAAAMTRLRQVMLPPELQPTDAPGTLIGLGK